MAKQSKRKKVASSEIPAKVVGTDAVAQRLPSWLICDWLWGLILVVAVILVYQPVWHAGFIWDDDDHVTANPCIIGPLALKENDHITSTFLQWFIKEQVEEISSMNDLLKTVERAGEGGLLLVEQFLAQGTIGSSLRAKIAPEIAE